MTDVSPGFAVYGAADPSEVLVRTIEERTEVDSTELPPLDEAIDPDDLDRLVKDRGAVHLTFEYAGYQVAVSSPGRIAFDEPDDTDGLLIDLGRHYLTEEYLDRLETLVEESDPIPCSVEDVTRIYLDECRNFETTLRDDTPIAVIRRIAFHQTGWRLAHPNDR